jgi:hypothetical protein
VDLEQASAQIDVLIERKAQEREKVNYLEDMWREPERRHNERLRREYAAAWYAHEVHMQELHTQLAQEHAAKAQQLLKEPEK